MEFKNKLKTRLYIAIIYIILGLVLFGAFAFNNINEYISTFGFILVLMGIVRIRNYYIITKNIETIRKQEIVETDERNISIINKAKSTSFSIYLMLSCITVIILSILNIHNIAQYISYSVFILILIYWICYFTYQKKL